MSKSKQSRAAEIVGDPFADIAAQSDPGAEIPALGPEATHVESAALVPLDRLLPFENVRQVMHHIDELAQAMSAQGLLQPIVVRASETEPGFYEVVAGHRRTEAARRLGWETIPAVVREGGDLQCLQWQVVENIARESFSDDELGRALQRMITMSEGTLTQAELARRLGKDPGYVSKVLRLAQEPEEIQRLVAEHKFTIGHYTSLARIEDPKKRIELAKKAAAREIGVREFQQWVATEITKQEDVVVDEYEVREWAIESTALPAPEYREFSESDTMRFLLYGAMKNFHNYRWLMTRIHGDAPYTRCWRYIKGLSDDEVRSALLDLTRRYVTDRLGKFALESELLRYLDDHYQVRTEDDIPLAALDRAAALRPRPVTIVPVPDGRFEADATDEDAAADEDDNDDLEEREPIEP